MTQQLEDAPEAAEPAARSTLVVLLDVTQLSPTARTLLREQGHLTLTEAAEISGPARLPRAFCDAEARALVAALEELGIAARAEQTGQVWQHPREEPPLDVIQHVGVREHY